MSSFKTTNTIKTLPTGSLSNILDTKLKVLAAIMLLISQLLIFLFLPIAGGIGWILAFSAIEIASLGASLWLVGEVLFFSSIAVLGKPVFQVIKVNLLKLIRNPSSNESVQSN